MNELGFNVSPSTRSCGEGTSEKKTGEARDEHVDIRLQTGIRSRMITVLAVWTSSFTGDITPVLVV